MTPVPSDLSDACFASTTYALRAASAHVERTLSRSLEPFGITAAQHELLVIIERLEGTGAGCSELGRHLAAPGPDVTRMLDRLDAAGLVSRYRVEEDRRVVRAQLTPKGRELLQQAASSIAAAEAHVFDGLDQHERAQLHALLEGIRRNCPGS